LTGPVAQYRLALARAWTPRHAHRTPPGHTASAAASPDVDVGSVPIERLGTDGAEPIRDGRASPVAAAAEAVAARR
jgi:hypothetical protein